MLRLRSGFRAATFFAVYDLALMAFLVIFVLSMMVWIGLWAIGLASVLALLVTLAILLVATTIRAYGPLLSNNDAA